MSENITPKHLEDIFDALPEEMDAAELSALTLTLHSAFIENPVEIITNLIASIYTYGETQGISYEKISEGLRASADVHSTQKTAH
jgi:hypothetical protein